jgi:hypothetical protein
MGAQKWHDFLPRTKHFIGLIELQQVPKWHKFFHQNV